MIREVPGLVAPYRAADTAINPKHATNEASGSRRRTIKARPAPPIITPVTAPGCGYSVDDRPALPAESQSDPERDVHELAGARAWPTMPKTLPAPPRLTGPSIARA